ncbi:MAG: DMT family transporter, partial [Acidobacteriota bacterium]
VGDFASPLGMNLGKCMLGAVFLGAFLLLGGVEPIDTRTFLVLVLSGVVGIALGDTFFFQALVHLGPRLTVLLGTLGPLLTITIAVTFLGERLSVLSWVGAALTLTGVTVVLLEDAPSEEHVRSKWKAGVIYALLAALCMSLGIIFAKIGVADVSALQATFIRIVAASVGLALWGCGRGCLGEWLTPFKDVQLLRLIALAVFVVIFGGFWLSLVSLKYIDASIATILNSTEPLFVLPLVALVFKEKVTARGTFGAFMAVAGVALVFNG